MRTRDTARRAYRGKFAKSLLTTIVVFAPGVMAQSVTPTGDVSPTFTVGPIVDLTGQRVFIGSTVGGVGTLGTLSVTGE